MSHWSFSRPPVFGTPASLGPHQSSSGISPGYRDLGDLVGIVPQDQSLQELQQDLDGEDVRVV